MSGSQLPVLPDKYKHIEAAGLRMPWSGYPEGGADGMGIDALGYPMSALLRNMRGNIGVRIYFP